MNMNKHFLWGSLTKYLSNMGLQEAAHPIWGEMEPHTYVREKEPINGVWFSPELEITSTVQLFFHKGMGNLRSVLVDNVCTNSAIGKQEFHVVHPHAPRLSSNNKKACKKYLTYLDCQMGMHWMIDRLRVHEEQINSYQAPPDIRLQMQCLNSQMVEMQRGSKQQC
jgi:hypothetical protein